MARKPNYRFERHERERAKATKKAAKTEAKAQKNQKKTEPVAADEASDHQLGAEERTET
jgi:hypothetical protein